MIFPCTGKGPRVFSGTARRSTELLNQVTALCIFRSMWAGDYIGCGHLIPFDVGSHSAVVWAAFFVLP
jgi:hypothetical protein